MYFRARTPDINLLPLNQLPVQKILPFTRPPTPVAIAYLSAICRAEGIRPNECFFSTLGTGSAIDLRRYINQCQLEKSLRFFGVTNPQETTRSHWEDVLEERSHFPRWILKPRDESQHKALFHCLAKHTDNVSYLDSRLVLRVDTVSELLKFGYLHLLKAVAPLCGIGSVKPNVGGRRAWVQDSSNRRLDPSRIHPLSS